MARLKQRAPVRYSVTEAKNRLTSIVHEVEVGSPVELTRRGEPVAVIVSATDYRRLSAPGPNFWDAYQGLLTNFDLARDGIEDDLRDLRDRSPGREVRF